MRHQRGPYVGFALERRAPQPALLFILCAAHRGDKPEWRPAWAMYRDRFGWRIRQWSWFDNGWIWRPVQRPLRISLYSRSGRG